MFCCSRNNIPIQPAEIIEDNSGFQNIRSNNIIFGQNFNAPIMNLPNSILSIKFYGGDFNYPLDNLPNSVKELTLNSRYNQPLDYLPYGLETLKFQECSVFSHRLDNLPKSLKILEIPIIYNHPINNIPDSIEELRIGVKLLKNTEYIYFPETLSVSENNEIELFSEYLTKLPSKIKRVYIFSNYPHLSKLKENYGMIIYPISRETYVTKYTYKNYFLSYLSAKYSAINSE